MDANGADDAATAANSDHRQLVRRNQELSILNAVAEGLNRAVDLDEALCGALTQTAELLGLRAGWIWLLDETSGEPELAAAQYLPPVLRDEPERMTGSCYCLRTFKAGDLRGAANVKEIECSRLEGLSEGTEGLRYHASVPLYAGARKLGVMNLAGADWRELSPDELQLLYTVGYQLGIAVERARLHARAGQLAAAEERARIARELHDSIAQSLAAIALQLETADALTPRSPARAQEQVREALRLTRESLRETRRVVHDLRAGALHGKALPAALRDLGASAAKTHGLKVKVIVAGPAGRLTPHLEAGLFRIAQQALTNAAIHGRARTARIRLLVQPEAARLIIQDDGAGFDPDRASAGDGQDHYGLTGMRERTRLLAGELTVESAPGEGTKITAVVPLPGGAPWPRASAS